MAAAKQHAKRHRLTLGAAVSDLVRRAADRPLMTDDHNGIKVVRLSGRSPKVTDQHVYHLLDEMP
jgi:hypothetical protein